MQPFAEQFYKSQEWKQCRANYAKSVGGLCECCLKAGIVKAGVIVHHKVHLTPENIDNPEVALNPENLILVCRDCHAKLHGKTKRYKVDAMGRVRTE